MRSQTVLLAATLVLAACAFQPDAEPTRYSLDPDRVMSPVRAVHASTCILHVTMPRSFFGLGTTAIRVEEDGHVDSVRDAAWVATPESMLEPVLIRALDQAHMFQAVVDDDAVVEADFQLQTSIERFTLVTPSQPSTRAPHVDISLRYTLTHLPDNQLLVSHRVTVAKPVGDLRMSLVMAAFHQALTEAMATMTQDIALNVARNSSR